MDAVSVQAETAFFMLSVSHGKAHRQKESIETMSNLYIDAQWLAHIPALQEGLHRPLLEAVAQKRAQGQTIYPPQKDIFRALEETPWQSVRVLILGQDPYHGAGQAHGLAFSVAEGVALPRSLRNIFREINDDVYAHGKEGCRGANDSEGADDILRCMVAQKSPAKNALAQESGDLRRWAQQGVLLLNTVLTVEEGLAHSHARLGWDAITRSIVESLGAMERPIAFLLWGRHAASYEHLVAKHHLVLKAAHPSPLSASRGFFGCKHFSQTNAWLTAQGYSPIVW